MRLRMKLSNSSNVPVYTVSGASTARPLPEWLSQQRKRSLKKDPEYSNRIELLQDFGFEEASQCVRVSDDGQWVMSTGGKPQPRDREKSPELMVKYRHLQAPDSHALSARSVPLLGSPYRHPEQDLRDPVLGLLQDRTFTGRPIDRVPHTRRPSSYPPHPPLRSRPGL